MKSQASKQVSSLEDLPNIGPRIANDLKAIGIASPMDLSKRAPLAVFNDLKGAMCRRHDPCVFYTLLSLEHFFDTAESLPWWRFTAQGKKILGTREKNRT